MSEPVTLALTDLEVDDAVTWRADGDDAGELVVGDASQRFEQDAAIPANVVVAVAAWLQAERAPDRPSCPDHGDHALRAQSLYDVAWWFCPAGDAPVRLIGEE